MFLLNIRPDDEFSKKSLSVSVSRTPSKDNTATVARCHHLKGS